ncbi:hypothetical protein Ahy_B04g073625 isoform C [Arachis hypogaea]|uniref:Uncharacterized protein n=1 Tax=Arachis hypogaea TaxID=3818 RepID=A0A444ZR00_ARAHY|nr:hypothetical protein Ahy_B04g073625 isoform C [Arachis hypogaea]
MVLISSPNPACTGTHKIIAEYIKTRDFPFCMWWKTGSVWIWLRHQKQSKTLSGPVSDPSKLGTIMVLALVKLLLKIVICDAYTPAGEPIPTNKRHNAAKIFSHPYEITAESFEPSLFFSHHIPVPSDRMKRKRGHKKGKGKSSSKHVVSETSALEDFGTNNDNDDDKDDNSGMEVDTPSSTGTDQQHYNVASINPDGSIDKTVGKPLEVGCFKVKLKTPKMLESHSQHTSSDAPTHSDPDKSSQQHGFDKQGVGADRKEDRVEDAALSGDGKVAKGGQAKQKSKKRHEKTLTGGFLGPQSKFLNHEKAKRKIDTHKKDGAKELLVIKGKEKEVWQWQATRIIIMVVINLIELDSKLSQGEAQNDEKSGEKRKQQKQADEAVKSQRRREKEEAELKKKRSIQKQASLMERFLKRTKTDSNPAFQNDDVPPKEIAPDLSSNKSESVTDSATLSMDSTFASSSEIVLENIRKSVN